MTKLIVSSLVASLHCAALATAPALAQPEAKTELVALDGKSVDTAAALRFRRCLGRRQPDHLYRDDSRDYYLVKTKAACEPARDQGPRLQLPSLLVVAPSRRRNSYEVRP